MPLGPQNFYNRLDHHHDECKDWVVVNWNLGNMCNFTCSYCPSILNDGSFGWNDFESFRKGVPDSLDDETVKKLMTTVQKRMKTQTESWSLWEIAPKFDWKNLRENYVTGKIFNMNSLVENLNTGLIGKVIRRGTNYLICVTEDNIMFKSWIRDLKEYTERSMNSKERVKGKPNTLSGTSGYFKNAVDITPGFEKGDDTNLQPGAKPYKGYDIRNFINNNKKK